MTRIIQKSGAKKVKTNNNEWTEYALEDLLSYEQPTPYIVESNDYSDNYKTPVLTAGKSFIIGYTNETKGIYDNLPVIIFDDFTTSTQYVSFPFKVKSSAMKILTANTDIVLPKFIFYRMQIIEFDHSTHKRYWIQQYSKIKVKIPSLSEQEKIVAKIEELPESQKPAYFAKRGLPEGAFRRIGPSDEKCSEEDMYLFYQSADTYDSCIVDDADLDDIDENALNFYRKLRKEVNPDAEELTLNDVDLLRALGAIKKNKQGGYDLTYTGLLVFGKQMSLRRLVPSFRVDYIRISGNQWVADGDNRFEQTIDMRGPLILMVNKACSAVMDDLPKGFELKKDSMQASTPAILPNKVLREAIVNSYIHRSNRVNQPIQIIRYSNRIEIHNPGYSLKPQDDWGEPGSMLRNPRISEIFHDTNLAETKGTGIGAMRRLMKEAGLMPPTFESNHEANKFTARLLLHHFLSKENMEWLAQYAEFGLMNEQKLALVFVREVGAIDNATYRQLDSSITHARARLEIHKLCDLGFIEKKGQGRNTYYIKTSKVVSLGERLRPQDERLLPQHGTFGERYQGEGERYQGEVGIFGERYQGENERYQGEDERYQGINREELLLLLPDDIKKRIDEVGKRVPKDVLNKLVVDMCSIVPLSMDDLSVLLHRNSKSFKNKNIKVLLENKQLFYWIPEMINHPLQKYVAAPSMARSNSRKSC